LSPAASPGLSGHLGEASPGAAAGIRSRGGGTVGVLGLFLHGCPAYFRAGERNRPMSTAPVRVAVVDYLNAVPLFWGLQHGPQQGLFQLDFMLPAKCADALKNGDVQ